MAVHDDDPEATITTEEPERVTSRPLDVEVADGRATILLPAMSWNMSGDR